MINIGKGKKTFYLVGEVVNMGMPQINIKLTENEAWAKQNFLIGTVHASSIEEAQASFRIDDMTRGF